MAKDRKLKKTKIAKDFFFISCSLIIIFYIVLFQGRTLVSLTWPKVIAQKSCITKGSRSSKITGNETKIFFVTYIYSYNDIKYEGAFWTKSNVFDSKVKYFAVKVNPKKPEETFFNKPPWIKIIIFFFIAISLFGIGVVNIFEKCKKRIKEDVEI